MSPSSSLLTNVFRQPTKHRNLDLVQLASDAVPRLPTDHNASHSAPEHRWLGHCMRVHNLTRIEGRGGGGDVGLEMRLTVKWRGGFSFGSSRTTVRYSCQNRASIIEERRVHTTIVGNKKENGKRNLPP